MSKRREQFVTEATPPTKVVDRSDGPSQLVQPTVKRSEAYLRAVEERQRHVRLRVVARSLVTCFAGHVIRSAETSSRDGSVTLTKLPPCEIIVSADDARRALAETETDEERELFAQAVALHKKKLARYCAKDPRLSALTYGRSPEAEYHTVEPRASS